jgi:phosphoserine phosphatase RsbU/P
VKRALGSWNAELQRMRKLTEVSRALTYAASLDDVFQLTVDRAADLFTAEMSLLMVANGDGCGSFMSGLDGSKNDHLTSLSRGRRGGSGLGTMLSV